MQPRRVTRALLALAAFCAVLQSTRESWHWSIADAIVRFGHENGLADVFMSGRYLVGQDGPFLGGRYADVLNFAWCTVPDAICLAAAWLAAVMAYAIVPRGRRRDGHTHCGVCWHILKGLTEPRCPECGTRI